MPIRMCGPGCTPEQKTGFAGCGDPQISYQGRVLATRERNGYDDSDFYAIVWDDDSDSPREIEYASTRGWTYHNGATIDADAATQAKWSVYRAKLEEECREAQRAAEAAVPKVGRTVRCTVTRGKNAGITGVVKWYGEDRYRSSRWVTFYRVGILMEGEGKLRFMPAENVEVVS